MWHLPKFRRRKCVVQQGTWSYACGPERFLGRLWVNFYGLLQRKWRPRKGNSMV